MNADTAILAELRALRVAHDDLHRKVDALLARKPEPEREDVGTAFCEAVLAVLDNCAELAASDLLDEARPLHRRPLHEAIRRLCRTGDCMPTARQLGIALKRLSQVPPLWFRVEGEDRRGTTVWTVQDLRD